MSRLLSTILILTAMLLGTLAIVPGASAQDTAEHPPIGVWIIETAPDQPQELVAVIPGGIIINGGPTGAGFGSWTATGERAADVTFLIPLRGPDGASLGFATVRSSIEVAEDGQSFTGTYTLEYPVEMSQAMGLPEGQLGPADVTGQRIAVEPMGEPVGPLVEPGGPDDEEVPPTPAVSPAPAESPAAESPAAEASPSG